jgi:aldehyde dehydrogenase (NAD+)
MMIEPSTVQESTLRENFILLKQKSQSLKTEATAARKEKLKKLRDWILANRTAIKEAMFSDFRKHPTEVEAIELFSVLSEIRKALVCLDDWVAPKSVITPLTMMGSRSYILTEPRGVCLILAPWNYPFLLCVGPLVSALAAGNTVVIKPSEHTAHVSAIINKMTREVFDPSIVSCYEGGVEVSQKLLQLPFDHIFFTGSPGVGKVVMKAAAENLASVTLELGGKSPAIIASDARIDEAAERTAVSKFVNNGQTCTAPDYVLVDETVAEDYIARLVEKIKNHFLEDNQFIEQSSNYCRIVNDSQYQRLNELLKEALNDGARVRWGGLHDAASRFFHPTVLSNVATKSRLMCEEIFGPVLPVITFRKLEEAIAFVNAKPKPLALYVFSQSASVQERVLSETSSGGACINDCGIHFFQHNLPFGGVNHSGLGKSHGYYGFLAFSNQKSVLKQRNGLTSVKMLYPPYTKRTAKILGWLFRFLSRS